jgi:hypothetical protein
VEYPSVICKSLALFLDRVNVIRIDAANARLRSIANVVKDHGVDYERVKFDEKLNAGTLTLERTTNWISATIDKGLKCKVFTLDDLSTRGSYLKVTIISRMLSRIHLTLGIYRFTAARC